MAKNAGFTLKETDLSTTVGGASADRGAVVIDSKKGPLNKRLLCSSTKQFRDKYGDEEPGYYGHYSALAALAEMPVYVLRTADSDDLPLHGGAVFQASDSSVANAALAAGVLDPASYTFSGDEVLLIVAENPGVWGNALKVMIAHDADDSEVFTIDIYAVDADGNYAQVEKTYRCSRKPLKKDGYGKSMYVEDVINGVAAGANDAPTGGSEYIRVEDNTAVANTVLPKAQATQLQFGSGDDGTAPEDADIASAWDTYFSNKNEVSVSSLIAGGYSAAVVANKLSEICGDRQDCVAHLDPLNTTSYAVAIVARDALSLTDPSYCLMYFPWVKDTDETNGKLLELPPSGYVAARRARKNKNANKWDAVFGTLYGVMPVEGVTVELIEGEQELLAEAEINPIINKPGHGTTIWGGRTLQATESARSWENVRELLNYSEQANLDFLESFIGKNNTAFTRLQVKSGLDAFYTPLIGSAFYDVLVKCDTDNNTDAVIDDGELRVDIYMQPVKPINRITLQVVITRTGVSLTEVATGSGA